MSLEIWIKLYIFLWIFIGLMLWKATTLPGDITSFKADIDSIHNASNYLQKDVCLIDSNASLWNQTQWIHNSLSGFYVMLPLLPESSRSFFLYQAFPTIDTLISPPSYASLSYDEAETSIIKLVSPDSHLGIPCWTTNETSSAISESFNTQLQRTKSNKLWSEIYLYILVTFLSFIGLLHVGFLIKIYCF